MRAARRVSSVTVFPETLWKPTSRWPDPKEKPIMTTYPRTDIDEELLAADLASGFYTQEQLARRHGVSVSLIGKIARGQRHAGVAQQVERIRWAVAGRAERRLAGLVEPAIDVLAAALRGEATPTALRAAQEILNRALGKAGAKKPPPEKPPRTVKEELDLLKLSLPLQRMIVAEMGGPTDDASWTVQPPNNKPGLYTGAKWGLDAAKQAPPPAVVAAEPPEPPPEPKPKPAARPRRKAKGRRTDPPAAAAPAPAAVADVHPVPPRRSNAKFIIAVRERHRRIRERGLV